VESPKPAAEASSGWVISKSPRAPRHWADESVSTFSVEMATHQYKMLITRIGDVPSKHGEFS
jgi:hypothetical protein